MSEPAESLAPLLLRVEAAAQVLGVGRTTIFRLLAEGDLESVCVGAARRIPRAAVEEYVERLRGEAREAATPAEPSTVPLRGGGP